MLVTSLLIHQIFSHMKALVSNQRGFSVAEALLTSLIVLISISALLRAYVYGTEKVERSGIERQALGHLQGELEKVRFYSSNGDYNLSPLAYNEKKVSLKNEFMGDVRSVDAFLSLQISEESQYNDLTYQTVNASIRFSFEGVEDTLAVSTKVYRNVQ